MKKTLKDIAKMVGVSPGTVSKVINNYPDVGESTRRKVFKVLDQTGYLSHQLKTKKKIIGVIYGGRINLNHPFFIEVINSFGEEIGTFGYDLLIFNNDGSNNYLNRCKEAEIAGCIIMGGDEMQSSIYDIDHSDIPCIGIDIKLTGDKSGYLMTDNMIIGKKVIEHFYLLGHRKIGHIGGLQDTITGSERTKGFLNAMSEFGLNINNDWIMHGDFTEQSGYQVMQELLSKNKVIPSAIFVASDNMAYGVINAIKEFGLKVPDDIAIIGCDDIEISRYINQPLTTIRQDKRRIGKLAAHMLNDLNNNVTHSSSVMIEAKLIIRKSCGAEI